MYPLLPIRPISDHHLGFESQSYTLYGYSYTQLNILLVRLLIDPKVQATLPKSRTVLSRLTETTDLRAPYFVARHPTLLRRRFELQQQIM